MTAAAINAAFTSLASERSNDNVSVSVQIWGGDIEIEETIEIPTNFRVYGNGVNLTATTTDIINIINVAPGNTAFLDCLNVYSCEFGINNSGAVTITNCNCSNNTNGISNAGTATITNCNCNSNSNGINNSGSAAIINCNCNSCVSGIVNSGTATITNCNCNNNDYGIGNNDESINSIIIGNRCLNNAEANIIDLGTNAIVDNNIISEVV